MGFDPVSVAVESAVADAVVGDVVGSAIFDAVAPTFADIAGSAAFGDAALTSSFLGAGDALAGAGLTSAASSAGSGLLDAAGLADSFYNTSFLPSVDSIMAGPPSWLAPGAEGMAPVMDATVSTLSPEMLQSQVPGSLMEDLKTGVNGISSMAQQALDSPLGKTINTAGKVYNTANTLDHMLNPSSPLHQMSQQNIGQQQTDLAHAAQPGYRPSQAFGTNNWNSIRGA